MLQKQFQYIISLIQQSRDIAIKAVNTEMINLYWNTGAYISGQISGAKWGEKTVDELAVFIQRSYPDLKGFNRSGLYRMKQFYETYAASPIVAPLVRQIQVTENEDDAIVAPV
jgi:DUF1016 N-terminal domain